MTPPLTPPPTAAPSDVLIGLDEERRATFARIADHLIPAAHGMPSAAEVVDAERLRFVLTSRPDLREPLIAALRAELGANPAERLATLERDEPLVHAALVLAVVGGYYTDARVRELIGYPGQRRLRHEEWEQADYVKEGLIDQVRARGPVWRDPATGRRAEARPPDAR